MNAGHSANGHIAFSSKSCARIWSNTGTGFYDSFWIITGISITDAGVGTVYGENAAV
jgi:hypothetical protein